LSQVKLARFLQRMQERLEARMRPLKENDDAWVGLDCKMGVERELNALAIRGYWVYHNFPGEKLSIDHIAVGPNGVFSVAAERRAELKRGKGQGCTKVIYDGQHLRFPLWVETRCLDGARRQAHWLSRWLGSTVGAAVTVYALLVLPGWLVNRRKWGDVVLLSEKDYQFLTTLRVRPLTDTLVTQISHQLERRCRDAEPASLWSGPH